MIFMNEGGLIKEESFHLICYWWLLKEPGG